MKSFHAFHGKRLFPSVSSNSQIFVSRYARPNKINISAKIIFQVTIWSENKKKKKKKETFIWYPFKENGESVSSWLYNLKFLPSHKSISLRGCLKVACQALFLDFKLLNEKKIVLQVAQFRMFSVQKNFMRLWNFMKTETNCLVYVRLSMNLFLFFFFFAPLLAV